MVADPDEQDAVLARLARVVGPSVVDTPADTSVVGPSVVGAELAVPVSAGAAAPGWVPAPPTLGSDARPGPGPGPLDAAPHVTDDATAARRALSAAMASYTAAHGHPLGGAEVDPPRRLRVGVGVRVAIGAVLALALVVGAVAVRAWQRAPSMTVPAAGLTTSDVTTAGGAGDVVASGGAGGPGSTGAGVGTAAVVVVHVVGEVTSPGVVSLEPGARVADAVAAAGGATPAADLGAINLARVLTDGEQVVVPAPGQVTTGAGGAGPRGAGGPGGEGLVDLNRADAAAFDTLPGIGPVLAARIVSWRDEHGRFTAVEELTEVTGIGPALLAGVRDLVRVG